MMVLTKIILAHFIGDFLLQPKSWVIEKETAKVKSPKLYIHVLIHGLLIVLLLWDFNYWPLALWLMISHGIIDTVKLYAQKKSTKSGWFFIDQALHFMSIIVLWFLFYNPGINLNLLSTNTVWIYATAVLFITVVSGIIMRELMSKWSKALDDHNTASLNNAGKYIGILERIFVFTFVITANWQGIGFLLAAKSVFRFGDLKESKDRKLTEYILIGTLLSFAIAGGTGILVLKLVDYV